MPKFVSKKNKFVLYTIPKCACVTMKHWFVCLQKEIDFQEYSDKRINGIHGKSLKLSDEFDDQYFSFTVVRNPYERAVSAFFDKINNPECSYYRKRYKTFKDWIMGMNPKKNERYDGHWRPQHFHLKGIRLDRICKLENLQSEMDDISKLLNIKPEKFHNQKRKSRRYAKQFYDYYDEETIAKFLEVYKEDFELLGYNKDINSYKSLN